MNNTFDFQAAVHYAVTILPDLRSHGFPPTAIYTWTTPAEEGLDVSLMFAITGVNALSRIQGFYDAFAVQSTTITSAQSPPNGVICLTPETPPVPELRAHPWKLFPDAARTVQMWGRHYGLGTAEVIYLEDEEGNVLRDFPRSVATVG